MELQLTNIVNVSVAASPAGIGEYNTSNLALFTYEEPASSFGDDGFKIYLEPTEVGTDFGTDSITYQMALAAFAQSPNLLTGEGYFVVLTMVTEVQTIAFSAVAASGQFKINFDADITAFINWDDTASEIQALVRTLTGLEDAVVTGSIASQLLTISMYGYVGNAPAVTISDENLLTAGSGAINTTVASPTTGETFAAAITRTAGLVQYFGVMSEAIEDQTATLAAAAVIQTLNKIAFFVSRTEADVADGGRLDLLTTGGFTQSRGLFYGSDEDTSALEMQAAYASRGLSTNFDGSNTTQTMHLKDLITIQPDPSMTQTLLNTCIAAGADTYPSFAGVPKVYCSGENKFFDQVYNLRWFVGQLQVAGFNALATTSTKLPQTEQGVGVLKGAYRNVCEQALSNQYVAPGTWNSGVTFGNQSDFRRNIEERGYYIYSAPVALQSQTDREDRKAPLIQIAIKEAGAIHSSTVIVYVNA